MDKKMKESTPKIKELSLDEMNKVSGGDCGTIAEFWGTCHCGAEATCIGRDDTGRIATYRCTNGHEFNVYGG